MDGRSETLRRGHLVCHCLCVETDAGLVLIDTGYGLRDLADPPSRLSRAFLTLLKPEFREDMTAVRQIERLGFSATDVRHIVLTHLDFDHAGGLDDFPEATIHMLEPEFTSALAQRTVLDRMRYRPAQWSSRARWRTYGAGGQVWYGFERVAALDGVPDDILMVPLIGHTLGHAGIAVRRGSGWLLLAGDAYFHHGEMDLRRQHCPPGLRMYQWVMEKDRHARLENQARLRSLLASHGEEVELCCAHDVGDFERLSGRSSRVPVEAIAGWVGRASSSAAQ